MVDAGLPTKTVSPADRRRTELKLTAKAEGLLGALTAAHLHELEQLEPALARTIGRQPARRGPGRTGTAGDG